MSLNYNWVDSNGNPAGGVFQDTGFTISWQNGPLGRDENRAVPNGAFVENVLRACFERLKFYQNSKFNCHENALAMSHINEAINVLNERTRKREERKVEGTNIV